MAHDTLTNLAVFALQISVIAGVAAVVLRVVPIGSAGTRYFCWRWVLAVSLAMPLVLQRTVPVPAPGPATTLLTTDILSVEVRGHAPAVPSPQQPQPIPWAALVSLVVAAGVAGRSGWLAIGLLRLRTLRRCGELVHD